MRFSQWLLNEDFESSDSNLTGDLFYPTTAGDYVYAANDPFEHWWLQWKWDQERKQGREFHNIDTQDFEKRGYVTITSNTMPDTKPGFWKHQESERSNFQIRQEPDLHQLRIGKNSQDHGYLTGSPMLQGNLPLDQIFGDKTSGKWPDAADPDRWAEGFLPYMPIDNPYINQNLGCRSKYVATDQPKEPPVKMADFGFEPNKAGDKKLNTNRREKNVKSKTPHYHVPS